MRRGRMKVTDRLIAPTLGEAIQRKLVSGLSVDLLGGQI
jgi:hypothetical protein